MKKVNGIALLWVISFFTCFGQEKENIFPDRYNTLYINVPIFFQDETGQNVNISTINFEHISKRNNPFYRSISLGFLLAYYRENTLYLPEFPLIHIQYNLLFGKKNHFFEIGAGFLAPGYLINMNMGYRLNISKNLTIRMIYSPSLWLTPYYDDQDKRHYSSFHDISVGLGYRFGKDLSHDAWDIKYRWLSNFQAGWQAGFEHYAGHGGFYGTIGFEFLLAKFKKLTLRPWLSYAYGPLNYPVQGFPVGLRAVYGHGGHFLETGMGFAWFPVPNGNLHGNYYTLQPEIGYRINLGKRFLARLDYTPYWWFADEDGNHHIERDFVHSATLGVGIRFH